MSDTPSDEDIQMVIDAGDHHLRVEDYQGAYDLLFEWHESGHLGGRQGEGAFQLGEACLGLESLDAAMFYFEEAAQSAPSEIQDRARGRITEIQRRDDADEAAYEGVGGEAEGEAVLAAADDALANGDHDTAYAYYQQAYDGTSMNDAQVSRASVGMAQCLLQRHDLDDVEGYLQVAESRDASQLTRTIADVRARAAAIQAGEDASDDGVERSELDELDAAAKAAVRSGDWDTAHRYFLEMYASGQLSGTDQGRTAHNLGITCLYTGDFDAAHQYLTEAESTASSNSAAVSREVLRRIQEMDDAADIVHEIDPDRDIVHDE